MLTKSQYEEVTRYKEQIESCFSNKEAHTYLKKLESLINYVDAPANNILSDLSASLNEYCKQGSDKEHWHRFVLMDYSKLERYIEDD
jgi:hypothetical protein